MYCRCSRQEMRKWWCCVITTPTVPTSCPAIFLPCPVFTLLSLHLCPGPSCTQQSSAVLSEQAPTAAGGKGMGLGLHSSFPAPSCYSPPFSSQNVAEEQSHSRCAVTENLWCPGKEQRKGGFFFPVAEEKVFHCHFELQLLLLNPIMLIYSKIKVKGSS